MKLGFVSTASTWGGGERLLLQLVEGCLSAGIETLLAAPAASPLFERAADVPGVGNRVIESLALARRGRGVGALWRLRRAVASGGFDAVVLNDPHAIAYAGAALTGLAPARIGVRHTCFPVRSAWKHQNLIDHVVCVSAAARSGCLEAGIAAERLSVVHGGLAPQTPSVEAVNQARQAWGEPAANAETRLLAIGSLLPVKGYDTLLRGVAEAKRRGKAWHLAIAGEGPEGPSLLELANALDVADRVRLLGFREDVAALLAAADRFVNGSHNEGLSLVLIEAMHAGTPIVSTAVGGSREVLGLDTMLNSNESASNEPVARVFLPGDVDGFVNAVGESLDQPSVTDQMVSAGKRRVSQSFSVGSMVAGYTQLVERLRANRDGAKAA